MNYDPLGGQLCAMQNFWITITNHFGGFGMIVMKLMYLMVQASIF